MAKTEMTQQIERALRYYHPAEVCGIRVNKFRGSHTAFEVPVVCGTTRAGLVDCMRVQEYFGGIHSEEYCRIKKYADCGKEWATAMDASFTCSRGFGPGEKPELCDAYGCPYRYIREVGTQQILVTCYEIKVSKSDFRSKNGHNFVGNCNYYIIPNELYAAVVDLVPEDIGIILYLHAGSYTGLRRKKECTFKQLTDEEQKWFLLSTMKRLEETTWKERARGGHEGDLGLW